MPGFRPERRGLEWIRSIDLQNHGRQVKTLDGRLLRRLDLAMTGSPGKTRIEIFRPRKRRQEIGMIVLLRTGPFGVIGRYRCGYRYPLVHGQKVICRTDRGLEIGEFLEFDESAGVAGDPVAGELVREMTEPDRMLEERLNRNRREAIDACQALIESRQLPVVILDAELTFDGRGLYFYFAGEASSELDEVTELLAAAYDAKVGFSEFAETLAQGCGPDCGTAAGAGCQSSGCASCGLKSACKS